MSYPGLIFSVAVFVVGLVFDTIWEGRIPVNVTEIGEALRRSVAFLFVGGVIYAWNVWRSAVEIYDEQRQQIEDLDAALEHATSKVPEQIGEQLNLMRRQGYILRNTELSGPQAVQAWESEVRDWSDRVVATLQKADNVSAGERSEFEIVGNLPPVVFSWAKSSRHQQRLRKLERQLQLLLKIMGRF